jgi:hypothetical protein
MSGKTPQNTGTDPRTSLQEGRPEVSCDVVNWVVSRLLMLSPAWVAACTVYSQDMLVAGGGDGGSASVTGGTGATTGTGASTGSNGGAIGSGGKGNPGGSTAADGGSNSSGGSDVGGSDNGGSSNTGGTGGDSGGNGGEAGGSGGSSGGASGSGGSGPVKTYTYELLDDFEDGDATGKVTSGRNPMWFLFKDTTAAGVLLPAVLEGATIPQADAEARPDSAFGLFISSTGFTSWGSGVGVDFVNPKDAYDASAYAGIRFYAKATSSWKQVRLNVSQVLTDASQKECTKCDDHLGIALNLTDEWKEYKVLWSALSREGWGDAVNELHLDQLLGVMFLVKPNRTVDLWIDDISLMVEEPTPSEANLSP